MPCGRRAQHATEAASARRDRPWRGDSRVGVRTVRQAHSFVNRGRLGLVGRCTPAPCPRAFVKSAWTFPPSRALEAITERACGTLANPCAFGHSSGSQPINETLTFADVEAFAAPGPIP